MSGFQQIKDHLIHLPLPGLSGQLAMAPAVRAVEAERADQRTARLSGVLVLCYADTQEVMRMVLMQRTDYGGEHSGQISFPGGKMEPGDADLQHTALRESMEEVGTDPAKVMVLRELSELYIPPSHFMVHPYLGFMAHEPLLKADPTEVAAILTPRLADLLNPSAVRSIQVHSRRYGSMEVPCYRVDGHSIWGATAMILSEALLLIRKAEEVSRVS